MLTEKDIAFLREELQTAQNPLFIHDDDADGLCSFLLLYRIHREGKEAILKSSSTLKAEFMRRVDEFNPDKIFILDIPVVDQEFIDQANRPIFWIDHHQPVDRNKVHYFNPRIKEPQAYIPTTYMAWQVSQSKEDLWIATVGCLADHALPDFLPEFIERYPHLLPKERSINDMVYKEPVGLLVKMIFFLLKGPTTEVRNSVKALLKITSPEEILEQKTPPGKFLYKRFEKINQQYKPLLQEAQQKSGKEKLILFTYTEKQMSFTAELSNEMAALHPHQVILICRHKSGEMKCSIRAQFPIADKLQRALIGVHGFGGGHPHACGAVIKEEDWDLFLSNFRRELESKE